MAPVTVGESSRLLTPMPDRKAKPTGGRQTMVLVSRQHGGLPARRHYKISMFTNTDIRATGCRKHEVIHFDSRWVAKANCSFYPDTVAKCASATVPFAQNEARLFTKHHLVAIRSRLWPWSACVLCQWTSGELSCPG